MSRRVDLNCDLGELPGAEGLARELAMLPLVTSINLACGLHAGDPVRMRQLGIAAKQFGIAVGAHPSYPDREGFGRRELDLPAGEIRDWVLYQIAGVSGLLRAEGIRLSHVKPHGALYNRAFRDRGVAEAIAAAILAHAPESVLFGQAGSVLLEVGRQLGLATASEVFADRGYAEDGSLLPRGLAGAVISEPERAAQRALQIVRQQTVELPDGSPFEVAVDTICVHGDTPNAIEIAKRIRGVLKQGGVELAACPPRAKLPRFGE